MQIQIIKLLNLIFLKIFISAFLKFKFFFSPLLHLIIPLRNHQINIKILGKLFLQHFIFAGNGEHEFWSLYLNRRAVLKLLVYIRNYEVIRTEPDVSLEARQVEQVEQGHQRQYLRKGAADFLRLRTEQKRSRFVNDEI
jgi:hypothetical protein